MACVKSASNAELRDGRFERKVGAGAGGERGVGAITESRTGAGNANNLKTKIKKISGWDFELNMAGFDGGLEMSDVSLGFKRDENESWRDAVQRVASEWGLE